MTALIRLFHGSSKKSAVSFRANIKRLERNRREHQSSVHFCVCIWKEASLEKDFSHLEQIKFSLTWRSFSSFWRDPVDTGSPSVTKSTPDGSHGVDSQCNTSTPQETELATIGVLGWGWPKKARKTCKWNLRFHICGKTRYKASKEVTVRRQRMFDKTVTLSSSNTTTFFRISV